MKYYRATTLTKYEALWTITKGVMADLNLKTKVTSFQLPPGINGRFSFHSFLYLPPVQQRLDFVDLHFTFLFTHVGLPAQPRRLGGGGGGGGGSTKKNSMLLSLPNLIVAACHIWAQSYTSFQS